MDTPTVIYEALKDEFCHDDTFNNIEKESDDQLENIWLRKLYFQFEDLAWSGCD